ncbi:MAG: hypothetical protein LBK23_01200, partial [Oscillospiraceae bacterium]|nr:hypothetical protein [Oscillospiraceae bacterium]
MKKSLIYKASEAFPSSEITKRSFKAAASRHSCALLARENRMLSQGFAAVGEKCAHFQDCFECLSPRKSAA